MSPSLHAGDRVLLRDRPWCVRKVQAVGDRQSIVEVESLDGEPPARLSVVVPPEVVEPLPSAEVRLDPRAFDSVAAWSRAHRVLGATLVREIGLLSGARFGRVALEAYQLAPALRLLAKPRPSLLIADDVGLGKTIEAGLAMLELMVRGRAGRILIVTPPGLLLQWQEELREKFALEFVAIENAAAITRVQSALPAGISPWDALPRVLTSVDFLKKETVRNRALRKRWDLVVVDEAHGLALSGTPENPYTTQRTRLGVALREAARGLVLLTATPHNGYSHSFRSLLELAEPTLATFHGSPDSVARRVETARIRRMKAQIRRRRADGTEEEVFPRRNVLGIPVRDLAPQELELLRKVASYCSRTARQAGDEDDSELIAFAMQIVKKRALSSRKALDVTLEHRLDALKKEEAREAPPEPAELRDAQAALPLSEAAAERVARRVLRSAIPADERRRKSEIRALNAIKKLLKSLPSADPKIEALVAALRQVLAEDPEERVIVFTEFRDTLGEIRERLEREPGLAGRCVLLHGGLSPVQRLRRQEDFERPNARVLLATDAASEGLNLQHRCRRVIHFELPWNPNRLEQRNGRVDRYGQTRPPEIRYLFYPDSPEDDVLHRLVGKIEKMRDDRVSTPDVLGVLTGDGENERGLVDLDPGESDVEERKESLVRHFEDRTAEFVRGVQPFVAAGDGAEEEQTRLLNLLDTAEPLLPDDAELERLVVECLGAASVQERPIEGVVGLSVPPALRGPGVKPFYRAVTFRRSVAVRHRADEVEYVTPLHPLVRALADDARRRLLHVYPDARGLPPRRLAALVTDRDEPASATFTYLCVVEGGGGLLEERIVSVRVDVTGRVIGAAETGSAVPEGNGAEAPDPAVVEAAFAAPFEAMVQGAGAAARAWLDARVEELRARRTEQAAKLRRELEQGLADRIREIDEEERKARGLVDAGQQRLFAREGGGAAGFAVRRSAAEAQASSRREEIDAFEKVEASGPPRPLGALLSVPAAAARGRRAERCDPP